MDQYELINSLQDDNYNRLKSKNQRSQFIENLNKLILSELENNINYKITIYKDVGDIILLDILSILDILIRNKSNVYNTRDITIDKDKFGSKWLIYFDHKLADGHSANLTIIPELLSVIPDREYDKITYKIMIPHQIDFTKKTLLEALQRAYFK